MLTFPPTLLILMAEGAPGQPGRQVLNAEISLKAPRPQALIPATRNLQAVPGRSSCFFRMLTSPTLTTSMSCPKEKSDHFISHFILNLELMPKYSSWQYFFHDILYITIQTFSLLMKNELKNFLKYIMQHINHTKKISIKTKSEKLTFPFPPVWSASVDRQKWETTQEVPLIMPTSYHWFPSFLMGVVGVFGRTSGLSFYNSKWSN